MNKKLKRYLGIAGGAVFLGLGGDYYIDRLNNPPEWYEEVWQEMKDCLKIREDVRKPVYFTAKGSHLICLDLLCNGARPWFTNIIILPEKRINDKVAVAHEDLHVLGAGHGETLDNCVNRVREIRPH